MVSIKWIYIYDHSVFIRQTRLQHSNVDGPGATDHGRRKEKKKKKTSEKRETRLANTIPATFVERRD
jgi:hypothetical protein